MGNYIPSKDSDFQDWLGNFISIASTNLSTLGLLSTEMTALSTDKTSLDNAIIDSAAKHAASKAATEREKVVRDTAETYARALVKRIQAKVDVPPELKSQLQINVPGNTPAPPLIPFPPVNLVANVISSSENELTWDRNGNGSTTLFVVEAELPGATSFVQVTTTPKTSYIHGGNLPGVRIVYQVYAKHGEIFSGPSNLAVVNEHVVAPS